MRWIGHGVHVRSHAQMNVHGFTQLNAHSYMGDFVLAEVRTGSLGAVQELRMRLQSIIQRRLHAMQGCEWHEQQRRNEDDARRRSRRHAHASEQPKQPCREQRDLRAGDREDVRRARLAEPSAVVGRESASIAETKRS